MSVIRLSNPVPLEAAKQLRRHMLGITKEAGYTNTVSKTDIAIAGKSMENAGISATKPLFINTMWDIDANMDRSGMATNGLKLWHSTCWLNCYMYVPDRNVFDEQAARAGLHADFERYFFPAPGTANPNGLRAPWTLPTAEGHEVVRYMSILATNSDADWQKKPTFKVDFELLISWAHIQGDLYYPA